MGGGKLGIGRVIRKAAICLTHPDGNPNMLVKRELQWWWLSFTLHHILTGKLSISSGLLQEKMGKGELFTLQLVL